MTETRSTSREQVELAAFAIRQAKTLVADAWPTLRRAPELPRIHLRPVGPLRELPRDPRFVRRGVRPAVQLPLRPVCPGDPGRDVLPAVRKSREDKAVHCKESFGTSMR